MPGDSQRITTENDGTDDVSKLISLYAQALNYPSSLCSKMQRKFKKHGADSEKELLDTYKRTVAQQGASSTNSLLQQQQQQCDAACLEELILGAMPDKNKQHCMEHLYGSLLRESEFFQSLVRAASEAEHQGFAARLSGAFLREHIAVNRHLAVSPRGAIYIVRRGAVRIFERGVAVATLERGAVFEVCTLSEQYVTLHYPQPALFRTGGTGSKRGLRHFGLEVLSRRGSECKSTCSSSAANNGLAEDQASVSGEEALVEGSDGHDTFEQGRRSSLHSHDNEMATGLGFVGDGMSESALDANARNDREVESDLADFLMSQDASFAPGRVSRASSNASSEQGLYDGTEHMLTSLNTSQRRRRRRSLVSATFGMLQRRRSSSDYPPFVGNSQTKPPADTHFVQSEPDMKLLALSKVHICAVDLEDPCASPEPLFGRSNAESVGNSGANEASGDSTSHEASLGAGGSSNGPGGLSSPSGSQTPSNAGPIAATSSSVPQRSRMTSTESFMSNQSCNSGVVSAHLPFAYGVELGVLSADGLRAIADEFPSIKRNLEILCVQVEVTIEKEAEQQRRKQELLRRRMEKEHKIATNGELLSASRRGSLERVEEAVRAGAGVNDSLDLSGARALHVAALFGHSECVGLLLRLGADPSRVDNEGRTPLHLCCLVPSWKEPAARAVLGLLLSADCPSSEACTSGATSESTVAYSSSENNNPLPLPPCKGRQGEQKALPISQDSLAVERQQLQQQQGSVALSFSSAPLLRLDQWGNTPLHLAAGTSSTVILAILMEQVRSALGPNTCSMLLTKANKDGFTPLEMCNSAEARRIIKPKSRIAANRR